ncbi:MAG: hypothetical protein KDC34_15755, partial [Saprospiraceae bacterium]|nr:hypothetical protein [Saprospiraceae bacterium]
IALAMASIFNAVGRKKKKIKSPNHFRLGICLCVFLFGCLEPSEIEKYGKHFQQHEDFESLNQVVNLLELGADTTFVKKILGEPINMGFDFRYLIDSIGPNNCVVGAVFHIDEQGKIDQKWLDEICE